MHFFSKTIKDVVKKKPRNDSISASVKDLFSVEQN